MMGTALFRRSQPHRGSVCVVMLVYVRKKNRMLLVSCSKCLT